jgi:hypothetical protein
MKCSWYDAMPMKCKCKRLANTEGVTALPLIKISSRDLESVPFFKKNGIVVL